MSQRDDNLSIQISGDSPKEGQKPININQAAGVASDLHSGREVKDRMSPVPESSTINSADRAWMLLEMPKIEPESNAAETAAARHRREQRYLVDQAAQMVDHSGGVWQVRIRDVSATGMQLTTDEPICVQPEVRIRWNGREVRGRIRYNHRYDTGVYQIGIELRSRSDEFVREILILQSQELHEANLVLQKQAAQAAQYASLLDLTSEAISVISPDGTILLWNRAAEQLLGWTREEVVGRNAHDIIASEAGLESDEILAGDDEQHVYQLRKDGTHAGVINRWVAQKNAAGETTAMVCISRPA